MIQPLKVLEEKGLAGVTRTRAYPAVVEIHVPSPVAAGSPFKRARFWHSLHRNNLARLMYAYGWEQSNYRYHRNGEGATLVFHNISIAATPGQVPEKVQEYIEANFGKAGWDTAKKIIAGAKVLLKSIGVIFPASAPAVIIIDAFLDTAEDIGSAVE